LTLPWAFRMRKTLLTAAPLKPKPLRRAIPEVWRKSKALRLLCVSDFMLVGANVILFVCMPFFFQYVLGFSKNEMAQAMVLFMLCGVTVFPSLPTAAVLIRRFSAYKVTALLRIVFGINLGVASLLSWKLKEEHWLTPALVFAVVGGGTTGFVTGAHFVSSRIVFAWIVDEDYVSQAEDLGVLSFSPAELACAPDRPSRRDGIYNAVKTCWQNAGLLWFGIVLVVIGVLGHDGARDSKGEPQNASVQGAVAVFFIVVAPLLACISGVMLLFFPLRGQRLQYVEEKYAHLFLYASLMRKKRGEVEEDAEPPTVAEEGEKSDEVKASRQKGSLQSRCEAPEVDIRDWEEGGVPGLSRIRV